MRMFKAYVLTLLAFCAIDFAWLGFVAGAWYRTQLGALLADPPNVVAAAAFYPLYALGITVFCVRPALDGGGAPRALARGALLGLCAYATYDLTNLATLKGWPVAVALVDMAWGAVVTGAAAGIATAVVSALERPRPAAPR